MKRTAFIIPALCLWAAGAFAGGVTSVGIPPPPTGSLTGTSIFSLVEPNHEPVTLNIPPDAQVYIAGRDLQKQLDAIQTQLKCVWVSLFTEVIDGRSVSPMADHALATKCNDAFKDIEPK